MTHDLLSFL